LKKQLKLAKKVAALKKALKNANPIKAKKIKARLLKARKALAKVAVKAKKAPKHISVKIAAINRALKKATTKL